MDDEALGGPSRADGRAVPTPWPGTSWAWCTWLQRAQQVAAIARERAHDTNGSLGDSLLVDDVDAADQAYIQRLGAPH